MALACLSPPLPRSPLKRRHAKHGHRKCELPPPHQFFFSVWSRAVRAIHYTVRTLNQLEVLLPARCRACPQAAEAFSA